MAQIRVRRLEKQPGHIEIELNEIREALKHPTKTYLYNKVRLVSVYCRNDETYAVFEVEEPTVR